MYCQEFLLKQLLFFDVMLWKVSRERESALSAVASEEC